MAQSIAQASDLSVQLSTNRIGFWSRIEVVSAALGNTFSGSASTISRIFRDTPRHLSDTIENHNLIKSVANDVNAYLGNDKYGNEWFATQHLDGTQTWVRVRNNQITNAGWNQTARGFNPQTGLNNPIKPNGPKF